ncbi:uncharacterized protein LY79DRAFT_573214 [Colletotrichum navitas]|uniref:Uncharacterized protein n=1 Tax=Colletotrichum navitas TaxID=681940 RepID=A0AAD8UWY0_9PEZI|nr:uncharacterized protein LY79DRAFT_573214 [Colletotrichum navitas]KAK1565863.1 hypothetical protein LY79DRAFT_573214 [Colletotrichum navitas]
MLGRAGSRKGHSNATRLRFPNHSLERLTKTEYFVFAGDCGGKKVSWGVFFVPPSAIIRSRCQPACLPMLIVPDSSAPNPRRQNPPHTIPPPWPSLSMHQVPAISSRPPAAPASALRLLLSSFCTYFALALAPACIVESCLALAPPPFLSLLVF